MTQRKTFTPRILDQAETRLIDALTRARAEAVEEPSRATPERIVFTIMAAASGARELPPSLSSTKGALLQAFFSRSEEGIGVTLKALGVPAIRRLRNHPMRLVSADGRVDYSFRFDALGQARFRLSLGAEASLVEGFGVDHSS
ncbi:hypothetical protein [Neomegalonema sp.]|uniref:hypothetical protein n=1 Tax=Neomegalonema sp. TaxID=2039713 RepID=UPI0026062BDD|nr:hypothetical protein [Neomegalonema sp.]MDD2870009.1 hypothetical protein [Neomegalonema sp.]